MPNPVVPTVSHESTKPEDVKAWSDYYAACEEWSDMQKPCMSREDYYFHGNW